MRSAQRRQGRMRGADAEPTTDVPASDDAPGTEPGAEDHSNEDGARELVSSGECPKRA